ncbi:phosphotransferase family protein [Halorussus halophilus]|uniref:phosphotransferase family protein n=1 Tax=Halorussus halophilus TaxID=2650975 RepID=UPI001300CDE5|nr:phosphotransferase family protein [Halorussus halophilus]
MTETTTPTDAAALESYLSTELGVEVTETELLSDKLNLILAISTEEKEDAYILHSPLKLRDTELFNELRQEYDVLRRLEETPVDAQVPVLFCEDESILGDEFFVTIYLDGETIPFGTDLPERFRVADARRSVAEQLIDTLAEIHSLDTDPFEPICDRRTPREQVVRATERLNEATSVTGHEIPRLRSVGEWLQDNAPSKPETTLVHGDFRPGNVLFAGTDSPEITGVLDWETAMLGDPLTELGYLLLRWRDDGDPTLSLAELEAKYPNDDAVQQLQDRNQHGMAPFTAKPGSPTRQELVARYEASTGISFENDRFYRAHAAFMLATVWADLHRHEVAAGAASNREPYVDYMSLVAESIVDGKIPL